MRISALVLGSLLFLGFGCSNANKKIDEFADKACACTDAECGAQVMKDFLAWAQENKDARGDEEQAKKSFSRMQGCISKLKVGKKMDEKADGDKKMDEKADGDKKEEKKAE
jgi:hypothetical protein